MHVISRKRLLEAVTTHPELAEPLDSWYRVVKRSNWKSLEEIRLALPKTDRVGDRTVFNIKGNAFRLIAEINYAGQRVYIRSVLTHAQYDKGGWK